MPVMTATRWGSEHREHLGVEDLRAVVDSGSLVAATAGSISWHRQDHVPDLLSARHVGEGVADLLDPVVAVDDGAEPALLDEVPHPEEAALDVHRKRELHAPSPEQRRQQREVEVLGSWAELRRGVAAAWLEERLAR